MFAKKIAILALASFANMQSVLGVTCTAAQLLGTTNSFRITGGVGGQFTPGTNQVISYDFPTGSPVTRITSVTIHQGNVDIPPATTGGLPAVFVSTQPDTAGSIPVTLPNPLAAGAYTFRLNLISGGVACTIDSPVFTVIPGNVINQCNIGDSRCSANNGGTQTCINSPNGRIYGPTVACGAGTSCTVSGNTAQCTASGGNPGGSSCTVFGQYSCNGDNYRICTYGANNQLVFTGNISCGVGNTCQTAGNSIICTTKTGLGNPGNPGNPGTGACTSGYMQCASTSTFQTCVNGMWGPNQRCNTGTTCKTFAGNYIVCA